MSSLERSMGTPPPITDAMRNKSLASRKNKSPLAAVSIKEIDALVDDFKSTDEVSELQPDKMNLKVVPGLERLRPPPLLKNIEKEAALSYGFASEASPEHPDRNEDAAFYSVKRGIQMVADGMGGVPAGDKASAKASEQLKRENLEKASPEIRSVMLANREEIQDQNAVENAITETIKLMDRAIVHNNQGDKDIQAKAMEYFEKEIGSYDTEDPRHANIFKGLLKSIGCTVSLSKIWRDKDGKDHLTVGNVGDSRTYRLRKGKLEKISQDSSYVQILVNEKLIPNDDDVNAKINKQDIMALENKYPEIKALLSTLVRIDGPTVTLGSIRNRVTMAAGVGEMMKEQYGVDFKPFVRTVDLESGDVILTLSDGVTDNLTDTEIQTAARLYAINPVLLAQKLQLDSTTRAIKGTGFSERAKQDKEKDFSARAKKDDVTAVVTRYQK